MVHTLHGCVPSDVYTLIKSILTMRTIKHIRLTKDLRQKRDSLPGWETLNECCFYDDLSFYEKKYPEASFFRFMEMEHTFENNCLGKLAKKMALLSLQGKDVHKLLDIYLSVREYTMNMCSSNIVKNNGIVKNICLKLVYCIVKEIINNSNANVKKHICINKNSKAIKFIEPSNCWLEYINSDEIREYVENQNSTDCKEITNSLLNEHHIGKIAFINEVIFSDEVSKHEGSIMKLFNEKISSL